MTDIEDLSSDVQELHERINNLTDQLHAQGDMITLLSERIERLQRLAPEDGGE